MSPPRDILLLTCEHGGNRVPARYKSCFRDAAEVLAGHRGHDIGALSIARSLRRRFATPLIASTTTRLLADLNRSVGNVELFSEFVRGLPETERRRILAEHYHPYREHVETVIRRETQRGARVIHVGVHTFTPALEGRVRTADIGLLYDPGRPAEASLGAAWQKTLRRLAPSLRVRRNYPYRGWADGLTTTLRGRFPRRHYIGLELEVNQRMFTDDPAAGRHAIGVIGRSIADVLGLSPARPTSGRRDSRGTRGSSMRQRR